MFYLKHLCGTFHIGYHDWVWKGHPRKAQLFHFWFTFFDSQNSLLGNCWLYHDFATWAPEDFVKPLSVNSLFKNNVLIYILQCNNFSVTRVVEHGYETADKNSMPFSSPIYVEFHVILVSFHFYHTTE